MVLARLSTAIRTGCLVVREGSTSATFGKPKLGVEPVIVTVRKETFWLKMFVYVFRILLLRNVLMS